MLFRRREPQTFSQKVRRLLWPQRSWRRSMSYIRKRVLRLNATPHAIAAGFAAGAFSSFTPFVGFHFLISFALSYLVAGNMAAAAIGTTVLGNPLTFPAIWALTYEFGRFILHAGAVTTTAPVGLGHALAHMDFADIWTPILKPMLVGALPLGLVAGAFAYGAVYLAARSFQAHRSRRIQDMKARRGPVAPSTGRSL